MNKIKKMKLRMETNYKNKKYTTIKIQYFLIKKKWLAYKLLEEKKIQIIWESNEFVIISMNALLKMLSLYLKKNKNIKWINLFLFNDEKKYINKIIKDKKKFKLKKVSKIWIISEFNNNNLYIVTEWIKDWATIIERETIKNIEDIDILKDIIIKKRWIWKKNINEKEELEYYFYANWLCSIKKDYCSLTYDDIIKNIKKIF